MVKGTDTLSLRIDAETNKAVVDYLVTTVDPTKDSVWIGIFQYVFFSEYSSDF